LKEKLTYRLHGETKKGEKKMSIKEQAITLGHPIVGKLTRYPELERSSKEQTYRDEAGNTYFTRWGILTIMTADGGVI